MEVERRRPMGIGAGSLALLSTMPPEVADRILDANASRIRLIGDSDVTSLKVFVQQGRHDGFVLRAPVDAPEILSLGVALRNRYGTAVLGLSVSALKYRIEHRFDRLLELLHESKEMVGSRLLAERVAIGHSSAAG